MASTKMSWGSILGGLGLAAALLVPLKNEPEVAPSPVKRVRKSAAAPVSQTIPEPPREALASSLSLQEARQRYNALLLAGVKEIKSRSSSEGLFIKLRTRAEPRSCQSGDFDIIKSLVKDGRDKVFLLSIERLDERFDHPSIRLSLTDIVKGDALEFALPKQENAQEYGVFLCLDPDRNNRCAGKSALATKDWNTVLDKKGLPSNILYFQMISTQANKAFVIPLDRWGKEDMRVMKERLGILLSDPDGSLKTAAHLMDRLQSLPAVVSAGQLELPLPYRDPRCDSKASLPPAGKKGGG